MDTNPLINPSQLDDPHFNPHHSHRISDEGEGQGIGGYGDTVNNSNAAGGGGVGDDSADGADSEAETTDTSKPGQPTNVSKGRTCLHSI